MLVDDTYISVDNRSLKTRKNGGSTTASTDIVNNYDFLNDSHTHIRLSKIAETY